MASIRKESRVEMDLLQRYERLQVIRRRQVLRWHQQVRRRRQWKNGDDEEREMQKDGKEMTPPDEVAWGRRKYQRNRRQARKEGEKKETEEPQEMRHPQSPSQTLWENGKTKGKEYHPWENIRKEKETHLYDEVNGRKRKKMGSINHPWERRHSNGNRVVVGRTVITSAMSYNTSMNKWGAPHMQKQTSGEGAIHGGMSISREQTKCREVTAEHEKTQEQGTEFYLHRNNLQRERIQIDQWSDLWMNVGVNVTKFTRRDHLQSMREKAAMMLERGVEKDKDEKSYYSSDTGKEVEARKEEISKEIDNEQKKMQQDRRTMEAKMLSRINRRKQIIEKLKMKHKRAKQNYYDISKRREEAFVRRSRKAHLWMHQCFKSMVRGYIPWQYDLWGQDILALYEAQKRDEQKGPKQTERKKEGEDTDGAQNKMSNKMITQGECVQDMIDEEEGIRDASARVTPGGGGALKGKLLRDGTIKGRQMRHAIVKGNSLRYSPVGGFLNYHTPAREKPLHDAAVQSKSIGDAAVQGKWLYGEPLRGTPSSDTPVLGMHMARAATLGEHSDHKATRQELSNDKGIQHKVTEKSASLKKALKHIAPMDTVSLGTDSLHISLKASSLRDASVKAPSVKLSSASIPPPRSSYFETPSLITSPSDFASPNGVASHGARLEEKPSGPADTIGEKKYIEKGESGSPESGQLQEKGEVVSSVHVEEAVERAADIVGDGAAEGDASLLGDFSSQQDYEREKDHSCGRSQGGSVIPIPNNVIADEKKASAVVSSKHAAKSCTKKNVDGGDGGDRDNDDGRDGDDGDDRKSHGRRAKNKERKKISLFGQVKPVDIIKRGVDGYPILRNEQNLFVDVLIIGSGISGLAASYYLNKCSADILVIEGRNRIGGRAYSTILPQRVINNNLLPETMVDLGANYLHCCDNADVPRQSNVNSDQGGTTQEGNNFTKEETLSIESGLSMDTDKGNDRKSKKGRKKKYYKRSNKRMKFKVPPDEKKEQSDFVSPSEIDKMEKRLSNNVDLFKQQYSQLIANFGKIPLHGRANQQSRDHIGERYSPQQSGNRVAWIGGHRQGEDNDVQHSYSDGNYFQARKHKKEEKEKIRKNILFMVKYNIDNICHLYSYIYKQRGWKKTEKDLLSFLKDMDENICLHTYLSDSCVSSDGCSSSSSSPFFFSSSPRGDTQRPFVNGPQSFCKSENKKLKILSVNKDTRRRRAYDKSVTQLATKLKPKISLVCGKDNWESTFYAYWYNNENGKKIKSFKIYRMNLLCDKIRVRAARKIKTSLFVNHNGGDITVDNYPSFVNLPGGGSHHFGKDKEYHLVSVQGPKGTHDGDEADGKKKLPQLQQSCEPYTVAKQNTPETSIKKHPLSTPPAQEQRVKRIKVTGDSQSKKKITCTTDGMLNYDKDAVIYENYYDYGEEYYRIVRKRTEALVHSPKKDINKTVLFKEDSQRRSMWDLLIECTEEILNEMDIHQDNFSLEEWKILMVMLQSRYGYGSDLRETSITMCRLPSSSYMDIDVCPKYGTDEHISKNLKYYDKIRKCEQMPHVTSFKDTTSADQLVLDGWKWLINFLSEDIQNRILLNTVAEVVHIKEERTFWGSHSKFVNHPADQEGDNLFINTPGKFPPGGVPEAATSTRNAPQCVRDSSGNYLYGDAHSEGAAQEGKKGMHFSNHTLPTAHFKRSHETIRGGETHQDFELLRNCCHPGENKENYNVMVQCKSYDTSKKQINKHFHGTSDLTNCNYANVNIFAKYVIVALPLGCLTNNDRKKKKKKSYLQFEPQLHSLKIKALNNYRMGNHNKIILRFYPFDFSWPFDSLQLNCIDQKFQFLNLHAYGKIGCILVHCFPPWSCTYGYIKKEHFIVNECLHTLHKMFENTGKKLPMLVDYLITKWQDDNFSFGSYAYPYVNCTDNDLIYLRAPHPIDNPKVVFCGEYLSKSYFQCVDGAYDTGIRAAEDIAHIGLKLRSSHTKCYNTDVFFFPKDTCPFINIPLPKIRDNLLGFYITDGSDEALTDYESSSEDDDVANISNIPLSLLKEEHDFLSYSLNEVHKFFDHLKGDAICTSDDEKQRGESATEKHSTAEEGGIALEQTDTDILQKKMDSSPPGEGGFADELTRKSLPSVGVNIPKDLPLKWLVSWEANFTPGNHLTSSRLPHAHLLYTHGRSEHSTFLSNYDEFSLYVDKYIIKMNDVIFHNYNQTELNSIKEKIISPVFLKSKFMLSRYLSSVLTKYHHFRHFIQRELFAKIEAAKDVLMDHFEWSNLPSADLAFPFLKEKITDHRNAQMSEEKKWESVKSCISPEQTSSWTSCNYKPPIGGANDEIFPHAISPYTGGGTPIGPDRLNGLCQKEEKMTQGHEIDEKNMNSSEKKREKEDAHKQLATMRKEKINHMYAQNRKISEVNIYLKYFLSQKFTSDKSIEENITHINKYQKIKLNCTGFLFFFCYLLKYIIKETKYDTHHDFIDSSVIIQLLCDYIYHLIFYKHDLLCYKCVNGGELIMCDFFGCTHGWHSYCLSSKDPAEERKLDRKWICPSCLSTKFSQIFKRGFYNQNEIIQNYWNRRVYIYKIKFFLSRTRRIRRRLDLLEVELSKRIN
ncbi:hypothetical protein C922_03154 [Plasmodium inui San Antonio 1]|uniref:PHD-type domain-containing protein n=1 Tax=Plasmodium inui San Antonio 1 TaxID=1237626 RepID=W7A4C5_9APIC|nr:hypothetical protein C922_03154 [Plasmodium inui San Antonio 1]EUD66520.1 hypothetical protein C922_03154 [Plasmodium inui San Antonio 1]